MPVEEFEVTKGLLEDDMRKQAGRIEKAWLEAVMNSVDAGASYVKVWISEGMSEIEDDGSGMTEEDIDTYYKKFGYKDSDVEGKTFGKFRRGRGQIFNFGVNQWHTQDNFMAVNLDADTVTTSVPLNVDPDDDSVERSGDEFILDTPGNSFNKQDAQEYRDGTHITVSHYKPLDDVADKVNEFKKLVRYISWMHDIDIYVNDEIIDADFRPDFETEYGYFSYGSQSILSKADIFNLGAFVNDDSISDEDNNTVPVSGTIITKDELDLNNARTEIIEGDDVWEQVKEDYIVGARYTLAKRDDINSKISNWLLTQSSKDGDLFDEVADKEILEDINGDMWSLEDLANASVAFSSQGDKMAEDAMERGEAVFLKDTHDSSVKSLAESAPQGPTPDQKDYADVVQESMSFEMQERSWSDLSKRRKQNMRKIEWVLNEIDCYDTVKPGFSQHKNVWRDDEDVLYLDEDFLNANKSTLATTAIDEVIRVAAAKQDTRSGIDENSRYNRRYKKYMQKLSDVRLKLLNGNGDWNTQPELV